MSKLRLHGTSSGYTDIAPTAAAGNNTLTAPTGTGTLAVITGSSDPTLTLTGSGHPQLTLTNTSGSDHTGINFGDSSDTNAGMIQYTNDGDYMVVHTAGAEALRVDSSGRLLVGTIASRAVNSAQGSFQIEGTGAEDSDMSIVRNQNNSGGPAICFGKSRNASLAGNTIVQAGDQFGSLIFMGNDGTDLESQGARIDAACDGTPGANDMPGRLTFSTTADGASSSTERMRIDKDGRILLGATKTYSSATYYDDITINNSGAGSGAAGGCGVTLISHPSSWGAFMFGDSDDDDIGYTKYDHTNDALKFGTGSTDRAVINSDGMAIAQDGSPATAGYVLRCKAAHANGGNVAQFYNDNADNYGGLIINAGVNDREVRLISAYGSSFMTFYTESAGGAQNEWMRIKQDGHINFHTGGNSPGASQRGAQFEVNGTNTILQISCGAASGGNHVEFYNTNGQIGRIYSSGSATTYSTSSDYRLKENVVSISDGISRVKALKPYRFNWKSDSSKTKIDGFFAHEVSPVVPEAIGGVKDAVEPEDNEDKKIKKGDIIPQSIDQSKLVPLLTAAIQELVARVEALESA